LSLAVCRCLIPANTTKAISTTTAIPAIQPKGPPDPPSLGVVRLELCLLASRRTDMPRKRYKSEEIVAKLRQVDAELSH
jgi:hypothetical protein